jgi:N-glycosylase/DNA lyase
LQAFRSLGFKTFFEVIDESYDLIEDKSKRWHNALDSMMALTEKDPEEVYSQLEDVLAHNKNHFENTEWKRCLTWTSYQ